MRYLLDTHVVIWYLEDSGRLSESARATITSSAQCDVSIVSLWEIAIKASLGRLDIGPISEIEELLANSGIGILSLDSRSLDVLRELPPLHRDPFDRALAAQAISGSMTLITADAEFATFPVRTAW